MRKARGQTHGKPTVAGATGRGNDSVAGYAHRLQWNENPFDYPDDLKTQVMQRFAQLAWARYPTEFRPRELIAAIAAHAAVDEAMVTVAAGSSNLIKEALEAVVQPGDRVVLLTPTFLLYRREALLLGAELYQVAALPAHDFALPTDALIAAARTNAAKLIALCAPNNPTGTVYSVEALKRIADESGALLVIDEAYGEFCGQDLRPLLDEFENVILLRTFSKAYALAGQRIGYALAAPALIEAMSKVSPPFPVATFSAIAAVVALENSPRFMARVADIVAERRRMATTLGALPGMKVYSSGTNFLLVQLTATPGPLCRRLRDEHNLLISEVDSYPELSNCIRISIGTPAENDTVMQTIAEYMKEV